MLPLYDVNPHRRSPVMVVIFLLTNVALFLVEFVQTQQGVASLNEHWSLVPAALWRRPGLETWLTPVTSMFLHGGWLHLIGNCWFLWIFGNNIEDRLGHVRFVLFYLMCGLFAAAAQVAVAPVSPLKMLGASGAISGILGAYMRYFPTAPIVTLVPFIVPILPIPAFVFAGLWFVFQFSQGIQAWESTGTIGGVAWWAHIGGFLAGFAFAKVFKPAKSGTR
jgi:membrane associated rhomboid family serine protease